jgi:uncharacterized membrane protein YkvA (DUF1232 family)
MSSWREKAEQLKNETYALYLAFRDPGVPWYAKVFIAGIVGYALSPIDLIPDFIPVIGYLDDPVIVPAGVYLALKMIPAEVLGECRMKAKTEAMESKSKWLIAGIIILIRIIAGYIVFKVLSGFF